MINQIFFQEAVYKMQVRNVELGGEKINASASSIPGLSECAEIELREYVEHVKALAKLLGQYKEMVAEDCQSVRDSLDTIKEADKEATRNFINGMIKAAVDAAKSVGG